MTGVRSLAGFGLALATAIWGCSSPWPQLPPSRAEAPGLPTERHVQQTRYDWFNLNYHQRSGCLKAGDQNFRFKVFRFKYDRNKSLTSQVDPTARSFSNLCIDTVNPPRRGEYATEMPGLYEVIVILWKNTTTGKYGYLTVNLDPYKTWVGDNSGRARELPFLGDSHTIRWTSGGKRIFIRVRRADSEDPSFLTRGVPLLFTFGVEGAR